MQTLDPPATRALLERLSRLQPETIPHWGQMSANQMICHLNDSYSLAMNGKSASEQITFLNRTLIRWLALRAPMPWPHGVPTRPEVDQFVGGTPPTSFALDKATLVTTMQKFASRPSTFPFNRHPIFGPLTHWEWMRWGYLHADHHFRQFGL